MTATTITDESVSRASVGRALGFVLLGAASTGFAGLIFTVVRVSWFTMTAPYCAGTTCTPATVAATDAIVPGRDALADAGLYDGLELWLGYAFFTVLVFAAALALLTAAAWALAGPLREWRRFFADSPAATPLRLVTLAAVGFVLLYAVNLPSMMWFTYVVD